MPDGVAQQDPELQSKVIKHLLRMAGAGLLGGAAIRTGISAIRNTNNRYAVPDAPKPVVVDMPYPTDEPILGVPAANPKRERMVQKVAADPGWLERYLPMLHRQLPTFVSPTGNPGASEPSDVPLAMGGGLVAGMAGGAGGYALADKVLRAADRWRAQRELDEAKRDYQTAITSRVTNSRMPARPKVASAATPEERIKSALDRAFVLTKAADVDPPPLQPTPDSQSKKMLLSALFPGLGTGSRDAAALNMMLAGTMGLGGAYMGYQAGRDPEASQSVRDQIKRRDKADAASLPAPLVARLVPVPRQA